CRRSLPQSVQRDGRPQDSRLRWFRREWKAKLHLCCSQTGSENALRPAQPLKRLRSLELLHVPVGLRSFPSPYPARNTDYLTGLSGIVTFRNHCEISQRIATTKSPITIKN